MKATFFVLSLLLFLGVDFGADLIARHMIEGQSLRDAALEHLHYAMEQAVGTVILASPFLVLAWLSATLAQRRGAMAGGALLLFGAVLCAGAFVFGYRESEVAMAHHRWTSAAISVAFIPILSVPVLLLCAGIRRWAFRGVPQ
jgi:hypothetical protein